MRTKDEVVYLDYDQAQDLVDRIADRCKNFNYHMVDAEKESMANLLSDIGVLVSDLIDVSRLADNYAINAEIIGPNDYKHYNMREVKQDCLFSWNDNGDIYYCFQW